MDTLDAISPIDGRYFNRYTKPLSDIFSERALMKNRLKVEGEYLIFLSDNGLVVPRKFTEEERKIVRSLYAPSVEEARIIKDIETKGYKEIKPTNHDVKSIEYYMKDKLKGTSLEEHLEAIHFALTSEDVNNIAYGVMLSDSLQDVLLPVAQDMYERLDELAHKYKNVPMMARTHGQPASPTTMGKEFRNFSSRLQRQLDQLRDHSILVKLNGATGNYNAHYVAYPKTDWVKFTQNFVELFNDKRLIKLKPNLITTQIEPHDTYAELFDNLRRVNSIVIDLNKDMWRYISDDWIKQKPKEGEVGSSTMPHKVNPIDFENSEGNLGMANALFSYFSAKLPTSRLQRDLSDSTVERNFGVALAHTLIGYKSTLNGLSKIEVNTEKVISELENHPEVISEAIQTILRREKIETPYEKLKELTRGKSINSDDLESFISSLEVEESVKNELRAIRPTSYTGLAELLAGRKS